MRYSIILLLAASAAMVIIAHSYSLKISSVDGDLLVNMTFTHNDSVVALTEDICKEYDSEFCFGVQDKMSSSLYNVYYTPMLPHATVEDYYMTRTGIIRYLAEQYDFQTYLEIGCGKNFSFTTLAPYFSKEAVCVDPFSGGTHRLTSDAFFAVNKNKYDVIFIDGLHDAVQVLKDVDNALKVLSDDGVILIHDCHPHARSHQLHMDSPDLSLNIWTGDVWKAMVLLKLEPHIDMITGDFDHGVGFIRKRKNKSSLPPALVEYLLSLVNPLNVISQLSFDMLAQNRIEILSLRTVADVKSWL